MAWLLEIFNVREKNQKIGQVYEIVYAELKYRILSYIQTWGEFYVTSSKCDEKEKHTWLEWYRLCKELFETEDPKKQDELLNFFISEVKEVVEKVNETLYKFQQQEYVLTIGDIYDKNLRKIIEDYRFEFYAASLVLKRKNIKKEEFWRNMDAINDDMKKYIENWNDIQYYNIVQLIPYHTMDNIKEMEKMMR